MSGSEWRTIDSAPKDGTAIILYGAKGRYKVLVAKWDANWKAWQSEPGKWTAYPTHWMPLPAPPGSDPGIPVYRHPDATDEVLGKK